MKTTAAAMTRGKTSGNGTSRCWGGRRGMHVATSGSHGEPSPKAAQAAVKCAALPTLRTSLDWVRYLSYVPVYPIEEALDHLEHEHDDDILLALFYSPDLFKAYNYVQWIGLMVKATCSLLRAGVLDPITRIHGDDGDADGIFSIRVPSSGSTAALRDTGTNSSSGADHRHARGQPPLFCRDLVLPLLDGILTPGDLQLMRDHTVRVAIIDACYPLWNLTRAVWRHIGRGTYDVHERYWDSESNDGDENDQHDEADATAAAETAEVPTGNGAGSGGNADHAEGRGKLQARVEAAASSGSCASTGSSTSSFTATAADPAGAYRRYDCGPAFVEHRNAFLRMLAHEGDLPDDIRGALRAVPWLAQQGGAASTAEAAEDEAREARAQCDRGRGDILHDWGEQQVLQQRHTYRPYAHKEATIQAETVTGAKAHRADAKGQVEVGQETSITTVSTNASTASASCFSASSSLNMEETRLCPNNRALFLARSAMDHPSVLLNVLQRSLDRIQQRKQRLVEKIFS
ncbi:hypothetical protein GH5_08104 [Leishmania sp. Ghana 2012 LV757]|uniref:hypothetical protein n=1 Tax=Leishmania sp. Ghana 2012 LV757 TaxID=2803181 RepID=UPI001B61BA23|nr:hypothetical protein GH5_08104 [Leishmania sp. Ghana 2012 LV757]